MRTLAVCFLFFISQNAFASCNVMEDLGRRIFPAGETLQRFGRINERDPLFHGSVPLTEGDFKFLAEKGIKTIVTLELMPNHIDAEQKLAAKYGIALKLAPMQASIAPPSEASVERALGYVQDKNLWPLYFHCKLGRDRTMMIAGLYMNKYLNKSESQAYAEMKKYGFDENWFRGYARPWLYGLHYYFFAHTVEPIITDPVAESFDPTRIPKILISVRSESEKK